MLKAKPRTETQMNIPLTDKEVEIIQNTLINFTDDALDPDVVLYFTDEFLGCSDALVAHGLNRVSAWLDGLDGRWMGDDRLSATWDDQGCLLEQQEDGVAWRVSWGGKPGKTTVTVCRIANGEENTVIATGTAKDGRGAVWRSQGHGKKATPVGGAIECHLPLGAFEEFCDFTDVIRQSVPQSVLTVAKGTVWLTQLGNFLDLDELLERDGGLPGRLARSRHLTVGGQGVAAGMTTILSRCTSFAEELSDAGAIWGEAMMTYNDGDATCCAIQMPDGAVGLYSDHSGGGHATSGYLAVFERNADGDVEAVSVHVAHGDDDQLISSVVQGVATPDLRYDVVTKRVDHYGGRKGHVAAKLMFLNFAYDNEYAIENGQLEPTAAITSGQRVPSLM
jgi:hypothetical protein